MKLFKILSVLIGIIFSLFLAEIALRIYNFRYFTAINLIFSKNPVLVYEHKPSVVFTNLYGIKVRYNSLGFFGEEVPAKNRDSFRILGVGDSITDGTYLPESKRYLFIIKEMLRANTKKRIEVVNAAVGGYNTWQQSELIKEKGLLINPDLIIVGVCLNDYIMNKPNLRQSYFNRLADNLNDGSRARYFDFLYQKSAFYKFVYDFLSNIRRGKGGGQGYSRYLREYNFEISSADFNKWKEPFMDMIDVAKENHVKILFVIFPLHNQIVKNELVSCKPLSDFLKTKGAYFLDLAKDFNSYTKQGKTLFVSRDIIHPNADGQRLAAEAITNYILENKMLE